MSRDEPQRLYGGEESAAYRLGDLVLRIGPPWRGDEQVEWCHAIALRAAREVPEVLAPVMTRAGTTVLRVDGRPITLWPYAAGEWADEQDPAQCEQAARLLARVHRSLAGFRPGPRPTPSFGDEGVLPDPALDRWLERYRRGRAVQPLHGDYHSGNLLARNGRIIALIDWDEAVLGVPEFELAAAALEFGDDLVRDLAPARAFLAAYRAEGGPAEIAEDEALTQLIRHKLRREAAYFELAARRGAVHTAEQVDYHRARVQAFHDLSL